MLFAMSNFITGDKYAITKVFTEFFFFSLRKHPMIIQALASDKKENPTNDALLLAFEDPVPATITSPFSADSPRALALDHELSADLPGFLSNPLAKVVSSSFVPLPLLFPDNDNNDDVFG